MKNLLKLIFLVSLSLTTNSFATDLNYGSVTVSKIDSIYDGDTFTVTIFQWPVLIGHKVPVHIIGIDTPSIDSVCPQELQLAVNSKSITMSYLLKAKTVELRRMFRDKTFSINAEVYVDGLNLGQELIKRGFARSKEDTSKQMWCLNENTN